MFRAELRKAFAPRSTWFLLLGGAGFSALTAYGYADDGKKGIEAGATTLALATDEVPRAWMTLFLFAAIAGAVFISREFDSRAIVRTVLLGQTRTRVFATKLAVVGTIGILYGLVAMIAAVISPFVFLPMAGLEVEWTASTTLTVLGVGACGLLAALWGSGVGWLLRSRLASVAVVVLFILLVEPGLQRLWPEAANGFFSIALSSIYLDQKPELLAVPFATVIALAWIVVLLAASFLTFRRRDLR